MPPSDVARRLSAVRASTDRFVRTLVDLRLDDATVRVPSLLPGWTRGHVLTHLARDADAMRGALAGALRGEPTPMYPAGAAARAADIDAGAGRPAGALLADVADTAERLDQAWSRMTEEAWDVDTPTLTGPSAAWRLLGLRWREIEIHWVDLDVGHRPADWPASFASPLLPALASADRLGPRLPAGLSVDLDVTDTGQLLSVTNGPARITVSGPSWALVGWLVGRPAAVRAELGDTPPLAPWS